MAAHVDRKTVETAVKTLRAIEKKHQTSSGSAKNLLSDDALANNNIYLQFTLKKIPYNKDAKRINIKLPHSLMVDTSEICLFTGDLDKKNKQAESELTIDHYREILDNAGIRGNIEVVPLRQLRTEYSSYEAKRKLCAGYDFFLADSRIIAVLPRLLGKVFFTKNKLPHRVNLSSKHLKQEVKKALSSEDLMLRGEGSASTIRVSHLGLTDKQTVENVLDACETLDCRLPGGWHNVLSLHLKTHKSPALPLYMCFGSRNAVRLPKPSEKKPCDEGDLTTLAGARVTVKPSGDVVVRRVAKDKLKKSGDLAHDSRILTLRFKQGKERQEETRRYQSKAKVRKLLLKAALKNKGTRQRKADSKAK